MWKILASNFIINRTYAIDSENKVISTYTFVNQVLANRFHKLKRPNKRNRMYTFKKEIH